MGSNVAMCIGGPHAGSYYSGPDVLVVSVRRDLDVFNKSVDLQPPETFTYRHAALHVDGAVLHFWVPTDVPMEGTASWILGSLIAGYRAPSNEVSSPAGNDAAHHRPHA